MVYSVNRKMGEEQDFWQIDGTKKRAYNLMVSEDSLIMQIKKNFEESMKVGNEGVIVIPQE